VDGSQFDHLFADGDSFTIGALQARVIAVPGHTADSNAYLVGDALFPGDSLFMPDGGTARCDFPGGDAATLYRSIRGLYALPDATRVFVCHDYGPGGREVACETTIGAQKRGNIHVRDGITEAEFVAMREARDATLKAPALVLPALQVNMRAGALPEPEADGIRYLRLPVDIL
jgi:glyoxylase-like metal-dependent hydrolase (beta-lactamase superfamily II)